MNWSKLRGALHLFPGGIGQGAGQTAAAERVNPVDDRTLTFNRHSVFNKGKKKASQLI